jgi:hypothetical protein
MKKISSQRRLNSQRSNNFRQSKKISNKANLVVSSLMKKELMS